MTCFLIWFATLKHFRNKNRLAKSTKMKSNTVWKYHLQFFKYFVCQEMKILIFLWKHSYSSKKWFKNNDFVLSWSRSQLNLDIFMQWKVCQKACIYNSLKKLIFFAYLKNPGNYLSTPSLLILRFSTKSIQWITLTHM